jgi:hypothetical protein
MTAHPNTEANVIAKEQFMTGQPVGWGIIGAGGIARRFASQLPSSATRFSNGSTGSR